MQIIVYRLRSGGHRIPGADPTLRHALRGDLQLVPADVGETRRRARLLGPDGRDLTQPLEYASVKQIRGEAMQLSGVEITSRTTKGRATKWAQTWLCVWDESVALALLSKIQVRPNDAFSPEYDDED
ncbi:hypothetical protein PSQ40_05065 [Curvibacter sp. HBC61]|uniref:Uncharacterized protein n=1 Tax=Curvibacter cyanobacteriorum TaxID=3026422 RepID=A0ABT5MYT2_9BURK|nr:hypothetical protein [Curvibacter sp. HBC61]MDD0837937.1 hypothetical protein [Curvibacter sp. HBC61]